MKLITSLQQFQDVYRLRNRQYDFFVSDPFGYISNISQIDSNTCKVSERFNFLLYCDAENIEIGRYRCRPILTLRELQLFEESCRRFERFVLHCEHDGNVLYTFAEKELK